MEEKIEEQTKKKPDFEKLYKDGAGCKFWHDIKKWLYGIICCIKLFNPFILCVQFSSIYGKNICCLELFRIYTHLSVITCNEYIKNISSPYKVFKK